MKNTITREKIEKLHKLIVDLDDYEHCSMCLFDEDGTEVDTIEEAFVAQVEVVDYDGNHDYETLDSLLKEAGIARSDCEPYYGDHLDGSIYGYEIRIAK